MFAKKKTRAGVIEEERGQGDMVQEGRRTRRSRRSGGKRKKIRS